MVPDGQGSGSRPVRERTIPVLDLRLLDGRPDSLLGLDAAPGDLRSEGSTRPRPLESCVGPNGSHRAQHGRTALQDDDPGQWLEALGPHDRQPLREPGRTGKSPRVAAWVDGLQAGTGGPASHIHHHAPPRKPAGVGSDQRRRNPTHAPAHALEAGPYLPPGQQRSGRFHQDVQRGIGDEHR